MVSRACDDRGRSIAVGTANLAGDLGKMPFLLFAAGDAGKLLVGWLGDRSDTVSLIWGAKGLTAPRRSAPEYTHSPFTRGRFTLTLL